MLDVCKEETMVIIHISLKTNRLTSSRVGVKDVCVVDAPLGSSLSKPEDTTVHSCSLVHVFNKTMCRIWVCKEVEAVIEVGTCICVLQSVVVRNSRYRHRKQSDQKASSPNTP